MHPNRTNYPKFTPVSSTVRQRVLSAKLLKLRSIQSQLNDANYHLSELSKENQILKNLQKRQDKALSKYENTNADLPRLIRGHEEQIRILTEKNKIQRFKIRELTELVKVRDEELLKSQERLSYLEKLSKDKRLVEKEKLLEQIDDLKIQLQKADEYNSILNRKLGLETKTSKQRLNNENMKYKNSQKELTQALLEIDRLTGIVENKDHVVRPRKNRFSRLQSVSMVTLDHYQRNKPKSKEKLATIEDEQNEPVVEKIPVSNVKLEPIKCRPEEPSKKANGILDMPSENIKNRLSSSSKSRDSGEGSNFSEDENYGQLSDNGSELSLNNYELSDENIIGSREHTDKEDLDENFGKLDSKLEEAIKKAENQVESEFEQKMGTYCSDVMTNVRECAERVDVQKESLKMSRHDTNTILETFEKTHEMEKKLKKSFLNFEPLGDDFLNSILTEKPDKNGNVKKDSKIGAVDRKKLLDTLKAIDDGDSFDFDDMATHKNNYSREIDELFG